MSYSGNNSGGGSVSTGNSSEYVYYIGGEDTDGSVRDWTNDDRTHYQQRIEGVWETISTRGGSIATDAVHLWEQALVQAQDIHISGKHRDMIGWNRALDVVFVGDSAEDVDVDIIGTPYSSKMSPDFPFTWEVKQSDMSTAQTANFTSFTITSQTYPANHIGVVISSRLQLANVPDGTRARFTVRNLSATDTPIIFRSDPDVNWYRGSGAVVTNGLCELPIGPPVPTTTDTVYGVHVEFSETVDIFGTDGTHGPPQAYHELLFGLNKRSEIVAAGSIEHREVTDTIRIRHSGVYRVNTTTQAIALDLQDVTDLGELRNFSILDAFGTFDVNPCSLAYNGDTYVMNKKDKQYDFYIGSNGVLRWTELDKEIK